MITGTAPVADPPSPSGAFQAGASKVDLTPIPGFPTGGHGPAGTIARGYWTRLFARAIYLEDAEGRNMVLVSCDLWSMPAGLADRTAELVAKDPDGRHIGREQIILAATHTHLSPGNFSSSKIYNKSASRLAGFDHSLFEFLAHRIAAAILDAYRTRRTATLYLLKTRVPGLMRNRSLEAFMLNPEEERNGVLEDNAVMPVGKVPERYPEDAYRAVDPRLTVLTIENASVPTQVIAVAAFVAVHPTSMRNSTAVYNSDLFGVAATLSEQALRSGPPTSSRPVVAIFNGAEGDISPDWKQQDRQNTVRLGRLLGHCILKLTAQDEIDADCPPSKEKLHVDVAIDYRFTIARVAGSCFPEEFNVERCTADHPLPGVAMLGGAEDGRTFLYQLGWKEGVTGRGRGRADFPLPARMERGCYGTSPVPQPRLKAPRPGSEG
jgi:neutral ceramidase